MKARLYRATGEARNYIDGYTLYFPYNKKLRKETKQAGFGIGCSQGAGGSVIRCNGFDVESFATTNLGRKVKIESMSEFFQYWVRKMERLYNDALKFDDAEHWEIFNLA